MNAKIILYTHPERCAVPEEYRRSKCFLIPPTVRPDLEKPLPTYLSLVQNNHSFNAQPYQIEVIFTPSLEWRYLAQLARLKQDWNLMQSNRQDSDDCLALKDICMYEETSKIMFSDHMRNARFLAVQGALEGWSEMKKKPQPPARGRHADVTAWVNGFINHVRKNLRAASASATLTTAGIQPPTDRPF